MKVAIISQYYPPERGAVRYCSHLAAGLALAGHDVRVIAGIPHFPVGKAYPGFRRYWPTVRHESGVRIIRTPLIMGTNEQHVRRILGFITFSFSAFLFLIFGARSDVIVASVPPATSAASGFAAAMIRRRPFVVLLRDIEPFRALKQRGYERTRWGRLLVNAFAWIYRKSDRVVVMHELEIATARKLGLDSQSIVVIPHGVIPGEWSVELQSEAHQIRRREGRMLLLYVGTIGLVHGLARLLTSLSDPSIRELPIDLAVVGDGECRNECMRLKQDLALDNVQFYDPIPPDRVSAMLQAADILVCSFRNEDEIPLSSKIYEYCASGKPILVHGRNLAGELVAEIGNGLHCDAGDVNGLRAVLADFLSAPDNWRARGSRGRDHARVHFDQSARCLQWERLLSTVTRSTAKARV